MREYLPVNLQSPLTGSSRNTILRLSTPKARPRLPRRRAFPKNLGRNPVNGGKIMSDLVFIAFPSEQKAEEVRKKVLGMQKDYLIELGDAVVAVKDDEGRIKLNQMMNTTAAGALSGAFWGGLIGLLFLAPVFGAAIGAASGALGGKLADVGINDQFMKDAAAALKPGTAGLFLLVRKMTTDKVLADLKGVGGTVMRTSFDETKESAIREALAYRAAAEAKAETKADPVA
jgi:uncharacterized membrane protein